jgi:ABC-type bacteriocin/lantibiotic exporter with double-glycine peptidase domain
MVLAFHGKRVDIEAVRTVADAGRDGSSASSLLDAAEYFGLCGRGLRLEMEDIRYLPAASILHWDFNHFVVFEGIRRRGIQIVDPSFGRCVVPTSKVNTSFTGIALAFEPRETFVPDVNAADSPTFTFARHVFGRPAEWLRLGAVSVALVLSAFGLPLLTAQIVDRVVPSHDRSFLLLLSLASIGLVAYHFVSSFVRRYLLYGLRARTEYRVVQRFLHHLLGLPFTFFQSRSPAEILAILNANSAAREILTTIGSLMLFDVPQAVACLAFLAVMSPAMVLVVGVFAAAHLVVCWSSWARQRESVSQRLRVDAESQNYQIEMLNGLTTLKAIGCERRAGQRWTDVFVNGLNSHAQQAHFQAAIESTLSTLKLALPLTVVVVGAERVLRGELSLGLMLASGAVVGVVVEALSNLIGVPPQLQALHRHVTRFRGSLEAAPEQATGRPGPIHQVRGRVAAESVSFRYSSHGPLVLDDVSIEIEPGQFVAIVGASGSGKSTLASLIAGCYRPFAGRVLYDGVDLQTVDLPSLRRQIGLVVQTPSLFAASIRENIAIRHPDLPLDAVVDAAGRACVHEEILAMRLGYETILHDRGASLSGGQRQRIALARALVGVPRLLVLDEATSSLDAVLEAEIGRRLASMGCARIVIAHRLDTIAAADLTVVMEKGRIVQRGRDADLRADRTGAYFRLFQSQFSVQRNQPA